MRQVIISNSDIPTLVDLRQTSLWTIAPPIATARLALLPAKLNPKQLV